VEKIRKILPLFSHFALTLMLTILANGVLFFHTHELDNGRIITHAHPVLSQEQKELPDHGHSEVELITLDLIAHADYFLYTQVVQVPVKQLAPKEVYFEAEVQEKSIATILGFDHRGPPSPVSIL